MKAVTVRDILKGLSADGWYKARKNRGSHRQFKHPTKKGTTTVNGKESDTICGFLLKSIERQSGLLF